MAQTETFTPGPWRVHPYRNHTIGPCGLNKAIDVGPYGLAVATVIGAFEKAEAGPEAEANARLIAAAPDMLAALREAYLTLECRSDTQRTAGIVKAALDKATA